MGAPDPLRSALSAHLPGAELATSTATFEAALAAARNRWPDLVVSAEVFVAFVAQRLDPSVPPSDQLQSLHLEDLYLACACLSTGDQAAACFIGEFASKIGAVFAGSPLASLSAEDFESRVAARILVGNGQQPPRLETYGGKGALRHWVGVVAGRLLADLARAQHQGEARMDGFDALPSPHDSPEAAYLRHYYREQFEAALERAFADLDARERELLRFHVIDQMPTATIAALFGVHRGTAARWLKDARQNLLWAARNRLVEGFQIPRGELDSLLRLVQSQLDVSVRRLLRSEPSVNSGSNEP